ncbi:MAG: histidine phosphatase family protein [Erysipelotrichaceae bacterium]|nr:histidine phosphatase family protein [Erysipelotrichaceae bacterium]
MKTVKFYYVRHGQTEHNLNRRSQGWCDSPLTAKGLEEVREAGRLLKDVHFDRAYVSSLKRCVDTAAIVLKDRNVPVKYLDGLREINFGQYEATYVVNASEEFLRRRAIMDWKDVGGENLQMLEERIMKTYQQIYDECNDGDNVLIISHGTVFLNMIHFMFGYDISEYRRLCNDNDTILPVPNGFAAVFSHDEGGYHLLQLVGRDKSVLEELNRIKDQVRT